MYSGRVGDYLVLFFRIFRLVITARLVAPRVGLRTRHDAGNIRIFAVVSISARATALARLGTPRCLFLLLFCTSALALALASRQRIPSSHLPLL